MDQWDDARQARQNLQAIGNLPDAYRYENLPMTLVLTTVADDNPDPIPYPPAGSTGFYPVKACEITGDDSEGTPLGFNPLPGTFYAIGVVAGNNVPVGTTGLIADMIDGFIVFTL